MTSVRLPAGHRLVHFEEIDSTNAEAQRLAAEGERGPIWIWSDRQSAGRGRLGRSWVSEEGNLFVTHVFAPDVPPAVVAQLSFVAALAVHDATVGFSRDARVLIKWPNDLLLNGAKFCGILAEALGNGCVGIGIGVNLAQAPTETPYPVVALGAMPPESFLQLLIDSLARRLRQWDIGGGFASIRADWMLRALGIGEVVRAGNDSGIFEGLALDGALIMRLPNGTVKHVHAGEVRFSSLEHMKKENT